MASVKYVYHMNNVSKTFPGGKKCFENIHLSFLPGVKIGVVGVNGAGKSSLMKIMAGLDREYTGEAWSAEGINVGYLPQEPLLNENLNVRDNILTAISDKKKLLDDFNDVANKLGEDYSDEIMEKMTALQDKIDSENLWELDNQINVAMEALRCPSDEASVKELSGGEKRRVALCQLLLRSPDLLLLDEPTNHLDAETVDWLQRYLIEYKGTCLIVTHDRYFLDEITGWILELDRGRGIPYEGNYTNWLEQKSQRLKIEGKEDKRKQKTLEKELEWIRQGAKARQAKQKARIRAYEELAENSEKATLYDSQIVIPNGARLGSKVLEVKNLTKHFENNVLFEGLSFSIPAGGIVGIIGPNGAGKTSLFKLITGTDEPTSGEVILGDTVQLSFVDQIRDELDSQKTVWEEISDGQEIVKLGDAEINSRAYCSSFNFKGTDQQKNVGKLSGGERNRVHMAKMLKTGGNLL
ncbi:MAG: energy-dependent translational throttle protein EttA, partial [Pseudomonadota bacterium]|nr:energy-dependent translational throttle protein EttA [Pseudomonadota bacterium]